MSLLEDVFLQDEADEAQDLERVIEGEEDEDLQRIERDDDNDSVKGDEAEEDKRRVDPNTTKVRKVIKNPRFVLNPARLTGPRGIQVIPEHFKDFRFKGKGHEKEDLDLILKKLEHWAYRLYPKFKFEDCLKKIETLGKKRTVMVHLHKIRSDQLLTEETVVQKDSSDEDEAPPAQEDEFDKLLQQQIDLARTPGPNSARKPAFGTSAGDVGTPFAMPKATSSPSISEEQRERMMRNKKLAEEKRLARLKQIAENNSQTIKENIPEVTEEVTPRKVNRSNVIDSSDEEEVTVQNEVISVDMHTVSKELSPKNQKRSNVYTYSSDEENVVATKNVDISLDIDKSVPDCVEISDERTNNISDDDMIDIDKQVSLTDKPYEVKKHSYTKRITVQELNEEIPRKRRSNVIDSSDDECEVTTEKVSIFVDIHKSLLDCDNEICDKRIDKGKVSDLNENGDLTNGNDNHNGLVEKNDQIEESDGNIQNDELTNHDVDVTGKTITVNNEQGNDESTKNAAIDMSEIDSNADVANTPTKNINKQVSAIEETTNATENVNIDCEEKEDLESIMDIDFTEEF